MKRHMLRVIIGFFVIMSVSCSSYFKRKDCEKKDWFAYGKEVAMKGQRLSTDGFYNECVKVEAELSHGVADQGFKVGMKQYCKPKNAFEYGKSGKVFNVDFCEPSPNIVRAMESSHKKGAAVYCSAKNGYRLGVSGKVYTDICSAEQVETYTPEYNRGRKKYLNANIKKNKSKVVTLSRTLRAKQRELRAVRHQIHRLPNDKVKRVTKKYDQATKTYVSQTSYEETDNVKNARRNLQFKEDSAQSKVRAAEDEMKKVEESISKMETELLTLD